MKLRNRASAEELLRRRCRADLGYFTRLGWTMAPGTQGPPVWTRPMTVMCVLTEAVMRRRLGVAALNLPPGSAKTTIGTRFGWPWAVLEEPWLKAVTGVHSIEDLGVPLQRDRLAIMRHPLYQSLIPRDRQGRPLWQIDPDEANRKQISTRASETGETAAGGWHGLSSPERGGSGVKTGRHPNVQIYDDLLAAGAELGPKRDEANRWIHAPMRTRFPPGQREHILSIGQRLHERDYTWAILKEYPDATHLVLPMEYDPERDAGVIDLGEASPLLRQAFDGESTLRAYRERHEQAGIWLDGSRVKFADWRRRPGELLMPEIMPRERVEPLKRNMVTFSTQYQQFPISGSTSPVQAGHWKTWRVLPPGPPDELLLGGDTQRGSLKSVSEPDWTALYPMARWGSTAYVLEEVRGRFEVAATAAAILLAFHRWGLRGGLLENAGCAPSVVSLLQGLVTGLMLEAPRGNTHQRVQLCAPLIHAGGVLLPADDAERPHILTPGEAWPGCTWLSTDYRLPDILRAWNGLERIEIEPPGGWRRDFIDEWGAVPRGAFDDRCDGPAYPLLRWVGVIGRPELPPPEPMMRKGPRTPSRAAAAGFGGHIGQGRAPPPRWHNGRP